jgi:heterodisulfide reductase subunit A
MNHITDIQILDQIDALLAENPEEKILAFACNWCSYAGADYAGVSRLQYPPNVRLIRTMCSGRVDESFIRRGFAKGAPVILVSGCHLGDCHYINANHWTEKRIQRVQKKMAKLGIRPERLQLEWISAAEGIRFADAMHRLETLRHGVTPQEVAETIELLANDNRTES